MSDDRRYHRFILLFRILFVEDTVGFIADTDTSETVATRMTVETVVHISGFLEDIGGEMTIVDIDRTHHLIAELRQDIHIVTILE